MQRLSSFLRAGVLRAHTGVPLPGPAVRKSTLLTVLFLLFAAAMGAPAQAQYFGKNKVQYRSFEWQVLESEHFDLYFYEGERKIAVDAARLAERAYARLSTILDHEFEEKIPLIIYASHTDFQSTNVSAGHIAEGTQGVTELMKRRVFLPFTGSYSEFVHVLEHELVHAFQLDVLLNRSENLLSNSVSYIPPLWVMEGMAEYLSLEAIDNHTEMWLRDAALQGYLIPVSDMEHVADIRVYRFGQAIMAYIGERFGDAKIGEILRSLPRTRSLDRSIEDALGLSMKRFSDDWTEHVRRTYLPTIADHLKPSEFARRLTDGSEDLSSFNLAPAVDPEGKRFVFISDRSLYNDLYLASAIDGEVSRRLVKGERTGSLESLRFLYASISWSPSGKELAFVAKDGGEDVIVVFDVDKQKEIARIAPELDGVLSPSWSPDGSAIVFNGLDEGFSDLYTIRRDGTGLTRLTESRNAARDPQWSPDGGWIVFTTDVDSETNFGELEFGSFVIGLYEVATGQVTIPPGQIGKCINPQWTPDGEELVFVSDRTGISNLYVMKRDGTGVRQLSNILSGVSGITELSPCISLSRDGSRLVFVAFSGGSFDVYAIDYPLGTPDEPEGVHPEAWIVDALGLPGEGYGEVTAIERARVDSTRTEAEGTVSVVDTLRAPLVSGAPDTTRLPSSALVLPPAAIEPTDPVAVPEPSDSLQAAVVEDAEEDGGGETEDERRAALADSTSFSYRKYRLRFSPDFVSANGLFASSAGLAAQTAIGFSDVLGNHQFVVGASIYGSLLDADLLLSYANLAHRVNWGVSLFQYRSDFIVATPEKDDANDSDYISQIHRGVEFAVNRPFNRFRRLELGLQALAIEERLFRTTYISSSGPTTFIDIPGDNGSRFFVKPTAALVLDNVLYGSTGPVSGHRSRFEVDRGIGGVDFTTFFGDYRFYHNIRQRYVLAFRTIAATSFGAHPQTFRIGGAYTLRGYEFGEVRGTSTVLSNVEFRYPLIDYVKLGWPLPIALGGIRGIMFFDAGAAWDEREHFRPIGGQEGRSGFYLNDIMASYGFGVRLNVFGFLIGRWDLARKTDLRRTEGPWVGRFSLGAEF